MLPVSRVNLGVPVTATLSEKFTWIEIASPALYVPFEVEELMLVIVGDVVSGPVLASTTCEIAVEDTSGSVPIEYVAVTLFSIYLPTSASVNKYVLEVAPGISVQSESVQLTHLYV